MEALFSPASVGSWPPSPVMRVMRPPGSGTRRAVTESPIPSMPRPKMSKPGPTFATVAGAKTEIFSGKANTYSFEKPLSRPPMRSSAFSMPHESLSSPSPMPLALLTSGGSDAWLIEGG